MKRNNTNSLISEQSPYLLQHAHNPVDWHPWSEEAFSIAEKENKPVFLSIGYSTCHWCHVMEDESFNDNEVAGLMNRAFVSIKVDREERPDIDSIYMTVCQMITGSGGWPLTIIMTPEKKPFFAATYLPKETRYGRVGMLELIEKIEELWKTREQDLRHSSEEILSHAINAVPLKRNEAIDYSLVDEGYRQLSRSFDPINGGFGSRPKFPIPHNLLFLLQYQNRRGAPQAATIIDTTLMSMRRGGIFDQIGYGIHRYSTDEQWLVPHFEKMLYDQALCSLAYITAFQATGNTDYALITEEIYAYVTERLLSREGGFFSAEDADSEGEEGKFYLWTSEEIAEHFSEEDRSFIEAVYNIQKDGNYRDEQAGTRTGQNILFTDKTLEELAEGFHTTASNMEKRIEEIRTKLLVLRNQRSRPFLDDKILTDWNGLMAASLAVSGRVLENQEYTALSEKCITFILDSAFDSQGRLLHRYRNGEWGIAATLNDYSSIIWGLIELYRTTFNPRYLGYALQLNRHCSEEFWDGQKGIYYLTSAQSDDTLYRPVELYDSVIPSGNSIQLLNLFYLSRITGDTDLLEQSESLLKTLSSELSKHPSAYIHTLSGMDLMKKGSVEIVVTGNREDPDTCEILSFLHREYLPGTIVIFRRSGENNSELEDIIPRTADYPDTGTVTVCLCRNFTCDRPMSDKSEILRELKKIRGRE